MRLTIPVPVFGDNENIRFEIREDGGTLERFNFTGFQSRSLPTDASALIVADPASAFGTMAASWRRTITASAGSRGGGGTPPPRDFVLDPARLPTSWLGFTSLRAVVIGPNEWKQLNDAQKDALLTWTACGGDLMFVDGDLKALFPGGQNHPAGAADRAVGGYFFGRIHLPTSASIAVGG